MRRQRILSDTSDCFRLFPSLLFTLQPSSFGLSVFFEQTDSGRLICSSTITITYKCLFSFAIHTGLNQVRGFISSLRLRARGCPIYPLRLDLSTQTCFDLDCFFLMQWARYSCLILRHYPERYPFVVYSRFSPCSFSACLATLHIN